MGVERRALRLLAPIPLATNNWPVRWRLGIQRRWSLAVYSGNPAPGGGAILTPSANPCPARQNRWCCRAAGPRSQLCQECPPMSVAHGGAGKPVADWRAVPGVPARPLTGRPVLRQVMVQAMAYLQAWPGNAAVWSAHRGSSSAPSRCRRRSPGWPWFAADELGSPAPVLGQGRAPPSAPKIRAHRHWPSHHRPTAPKQCSTLAAPGSGDRP